MMLRAVAGGAVVSFELQAVSRPAINSCAVALTVNVAKI